LNFTRVKFPNPKTLIPFIGGIGAILLFNQVEFQEGISLSYFIWDSWGKANFYQGLVWGY